MSYPQNLTKFDNFFCIIKHFHPPSWRLSGPETGFCKKKIKILTKFRVNLTKFPVNLTNLTKFDQIFDRI